jgi:hypothetical protein
VDRRRAEIEDEFATRRTELEASVAREVAESEARLLRLSEERAETERAVEALEGELVLAVERQVAGVCHDSPTTY